MNFCVCCWQFDSNLMDINVYCLPFMFLFVVVGFTFVIFFGSLWKVKQAIELGQFTESHKRHINLNKIRANAKKK